MVNEARDKVVRKELSRQPATVNMSDGAGRDGASP